MPEFLTAEYVPHGHCLTWRQDILVLYVVSDIIIGLSYFSLAAALGKLTYLRRDPYFFSIFSLLTLFIAISGLRHLLAICTIWSAAYGLEGVIKAITACLSVIVAVVVWSFLPEVIKLPSRKNLQALVNKKTEALSTAYTNLTIANSQLAYQTDILHGFLRNAASAMWLTRPDGRYELVNGAWCTATGISEQNALNPPKKTPKSLLESPELDAKVRQTLTSQSIHLDIEDKWTFILTRYPICDPDGEILLGGTATDITALRDVERTVRAANERLTSANNYLQQFSSVAAHDLKAPLNNVTTLLSLIWRQSEQKLSNKEKSLFMKVTQKTNRMRFLIDSLRALAEVRIDPDRQVSTRLEVALEETKTDLEKQIRLSQGTIEITANEGPIYMDRQLLHQLFVNIIGNSLKYRKPDTPPYIKVSTKTDPKHLILIVEDNGIGFSPEHSERLFEPLQRLHTQKADGLGLGLALCKRIVQAHGGEIFATGRPTQGTTLRIRLPKAPE